MLHFINAKMILWILQLLNSRSQTGVKCNIFAKTGIKPEQESHFSE